MEGLNFGSAVNDDKVIDLKNMWLPWFAGGKIHLAANTTYKVIAESGGELNSRCVHHQTQWLFAPRWARRLIITSSMGQSRTR